VDIIDIHPHVISADHTRYPFAPISGKLSHWVEERPVTTEEMLVQMDAAGIARSVLVHASTAYGYDNSYASDSAAAHPDRFTSVCCVDVRAADAPERLRYWIRERQMTGLRIFTSGSAQADDSAWIDDPITMPAWEAAAELAIPVCLQMKASGFPHLQTILKRFPKVPVILDHLAHPPASDGPPYAAAAELWKLAAFPTVYLKLTAHNFKEFAEGAGTAQTFIAACIERFGADHIAWGSNFPSSKGPLADLVALAQRELAFLSAADQRAIFHDTAAALYPAVATARVPAA
jgi:predicted TIM-barrel fold metal-dependent hydrolase